MRNTFPVYPETETRDLIRVVGLFLLSLEDISIVCIVSLSFVPRDDAKVFVLHFFVLHFFVLHFFVFFVFSRAFKVVVVVVVV